MNSWILVYTGLGLIVLELILGVATGFDLLLIGTSLLIGGAVGNSTNNPNLGIIVSIICIVLYFVAGRNIVRKRLNQKIVKTNSDTIVGKTGTVVKKDQVKIENEIWRLETSDQVKTGDKVKIISIAGVTVTGVKYN